MGGNNEIKDEIKEISGLSDEKFYAKIIVVGG